MNKMVNMNMFISLFKVFFFVLPILVVICNKDDLINTDECIINSKHETIGGDNYCIDIDENGIITLYSNAIELDPCLFQDKELKKKFQLIVSTTRCISAESIKQFTLEYNKAITDLTGFEQFANLDLELLKFDFNSIIDLSPLSKFKKLKTLSLFDNRIVDLTPLSSLTSLISLNLSDNNIEDITPLSSLMKLTGLNLMFNNVEDVSPLSSLTSLVRLYLGVNNVEDISALSSLLNLKTLEIGNNATVDITPLSSLTNLTELSLSNNSIIDPSPLSSLVNLTELYLYGNNELDCERLELLIKQLPNCFIGKPDHCRLK